MLKLNYIIVDNLPKQEQQYLEENLRKDKAEEEHGCWIVREYAKEIDTIGAASDRCIFISGNREHLKTMAEQGIATVGYLMPECVHDKDDDPKCPNSIKPHLGESTDRSNCKEPGCANTAEAGEDCAENINYVKVNNVKDNNAKDNNVKNENFRVDMYAEGFEEVGLAFLNRVFERHHHIPWTILETARCLVREFSMGDLDDLFALYAWDGMTEYMEPLYEYEQEKEYQKAYIKYMYGFYGYGMWLVIEKETGRLIGRIGIEHREELGGEPELGYAIGTPYQRKGYAAEVCTAVLAYAKRELDIPQINCLIEEGNTVSGHLARKLGFSFGGSLEVSGKQMKKYVLLF